MKQIIEDYVSFEIAQLLKEKEFDIKCNTYFISDNEIAAIPISRDFNNNGIHLSAPSQSLALKWLRKVHNIYIDILTYTTGKNIQFRWVGYDNGRLFSQEEGKIIYFESYEKAVEAALLYVLKKLI